MLKRGLKLSSELNSSLLYIHPPIAVAGYAFIFLFTIFLFSRKNNSKTTWILGSTAWTLTFVGLATGMLWAQLAWGSYWSWDPKETLTLALFVAFSTAMLALSEKHLNTAKYLGITSCLLAAITGSSSFILTGLHSFLH